MRIKNKVLIATQLGLLGGEEFSILDIINYLGSKYDFTVLLSNKGPFLKILKEKNIPFIIIKLKAHHDIRAFIKILNILKSDQFDIIHLHSPRMAYYFLLANVIAKKNNILWTHHVFIGDAFPLKTLKGKLYFTGIKLLYKTAFLNITVSDYIKNQYIKYGLENKKFIRIYNGINIEDKNIYKRKHNKGKLRFGIMSRHETFKGYPVLMEMIKKYDIKNFELHIFNRGSLTAKIKKIIKDKNNIYYHGFVHNKGKIFNNFDVLLLLSDFEGFGYVTIEALLYRKPIIARDNLLNREILKGYPEIGFIKNFTPVGLFDKINEIMEENNLNNLQKYIDNFDFLPFDIKNNMEKIDQIYGKIL